ncbi:MULTISPECIES: hypothetical protein [unclassified Pseudomonas]|uniref:hypothetical protein n=1 Tax=unclassified Pseudomonas TaxID=196821 RepID=UPI00391815EC
MPFIIFCYLTAYLDRFNVGFAKLQMMQDPQFSDAMTADRTAKRRQHFSGALLIGALGFIVCPLVGADPPPIATAHRHWPATG